MAVGTSHCGDRGCRMGGLEYRWKGRWREWRSCCSVTQSVWAGWVEPSLSVLPPSSLFLSLDLSLSLITHFLVQTVRLPGFSLVSSAAHDAAVISVDTGSISFTASSITSITCAITSAHFPDGASAFSSSVTWLGAGTSAEVVA